MKESFEGQAENPAELPKGEPTIKELKKLGNSFLPRREYREGDTSLDFRYSFPTGEVLRANEVNGEVSIVLERDGETIRNLKDFLPEGYRFASPSTVYVGMEKNKKYRGKWCHWEKEKVVAVGDWRTPQELFVLLHEIGHSRDERQSGSVHNSDNPSADEKRKGVIRQLSQRERFATAEGLYLARDILKKDGVNVFSVFSSREELRDYIYKALCTHRIQNRRYSEVLEMYNSIWDYIKKYVFKIKPEELDAEEEFWGELFDKNYFNRKQKT